MHEPSDFSSFGKTTIMSALPDKHQHKPTKWFGEEAELTTSSKQQKTLAAKSTAKAKPAKPIAPPKKSAINRSPSVKVEEINDPADQPKSNPPYNSAHILEKADGTEDNDKPPVCTLKGKGKKTVIPDTEDEGSEPDSEPAAESAKAELSMLSKLPPKPGTH